MKIYNRQSYYLNFWHRQLLIYPKAINLFEKSVSELKVAVIKIKLFLKVNKSTKLFLGILQFYNFSVMISITTSVGISVNNDVTSSNISL